MPQIEKTPQSTAKNKWSSTLVPIKSRKIKRQAKRTVLLPWSFCWKDIPFTKIHRSIVHWSPFVTKITESALQELFTLFTKWIPESNTLLLHKDYHKDPMIATLIDWNEELIQTKYIFSRDSVSPCSYSFVCILSLYVWIRMILIIQNLPELRS